MIMLDIKTFTVKEFYYLSFSRVAIVGFFDEVFSKDDCVPVGSESYDVFLKKGEKKIYLENVGISTSSMKKTTLYHTGLI